MIRKYIFLIFFFVFLSQLINGQTKDFQPEWSVGIGFGPTFSSVSFDTGKAGENIATNTWQRYSGGLALRYISEKNLGLIVELNYSQQGWEENFKDQPEFSYSHQLNYLEMPVLTHIYFGNKVRFIVNLGPKLSYLMNDSENMNEALADYIASGSASSTFVTHQYYRSAERKIDYGLLGGLGLEFRTGIGNFTLEGRYSFSLGDIYNNKKSDYFNRSANRVISAKLTYYVKLF